MYGSGYLEVLGFPAIRVWGFKGLGLSWVGVLRVPRGGCEDSNEIPCNTAYIGIKSGQAERCYLQSDPFSKYMSYKLVMGAISPDDPVRRFVGGERHLKERWYTYNDTCRV